MEAKMSKKMAVAKKIFEYMAVVFYSVLIIGVILTPLTVIDKNLPNYDLCLFIYISVLLTMIVAIVGTLYKKINISSADT